MTLKILRENTLLLVAILTFLTLHLTKDQFPYDLNNILPITHK